MKKSMVKPLTLIRKNEIAKRAETADAKREAKIEAERNAQNLEIIITGEYPDGKEMDPEKARALWEEMSG